jgi:hypothetical protein
VRTTTWFPPRGASEGCHRRNAPTRLRAEDARRAVKLAYIISAYKLPEQLRRLVETLATDTSSFVIHVDKKTDDGTYRRMVSSLDQLGNVHFLERHRSY